MISLCVYALPFFLPFSSPPPPIPPFPRPLSLTPLLPVLSSPRAHTLQLYQSAGGVHSPSADHSSSSPSPISSQFTSSSTRRGDSDGGGEKETNEGSSEEISFQSPRDAQSSEEGQGSCEAEDSVSQYVFIIIFLALIPSSFPLSPSYQHLDHFSLSPRHSSGSRSHLMVKQKATRSLSSVSLTYRPEEASPRSSPGSSSAFPRYAPLSSKSSRNKFADVVINLPDKAAAERLLKFGPHPSFSSLFSPFPLPFLFSCGFCVFPPLCPPHSLCR